MHPFIIGQPFRLRAFRDAIRHIVRHCDRLWITTPGETEKTRVFSRLLQHLVELVSYHLGELPSGVAPVKQSRQVVDFEGIRHRPARRGCASRSADPPKFVVALSMTNNYPSGFREDYSYEWFSGS